MTIKDINTELRQSVRDFGSAMSAAASHADPHLSEAGVIAKRQSLAQTAREAGAGKLATLRGRYDAAALSLRGSLERALPTNPQSTADAWSKVKMLIDAGQPLSHIVGKASPEQLHALTEWGPVYLDSITPVHLGLDAGEPRVVPVETLQRSIWERWAQILPAQPAAAVRGFLEAAPEIASFESYASFAEGHIGGVSSMSPMEAAITAKMAHQSAAQGLTAPEVDDGQVAA